MSAQPLNSMAMDLGDQLPDFDGGAQEQPKPMMRAVQTPHGILFKDLDIGRVEINHALVGGREVFQLVYTTEEGHAEDLIVATPTMYQHFSVSGGQYSKASFQLAMPDESAVQAEHHQLMAFNQALQGRVCALWVDLCLAKDEVLRKKHNMAFHGLGGDRDAMMQVADSVVAPLVYKNKKGEWNMRVTVLERPSWNKQATLATNVQMVDAAWQPVSRAKTVHDIGIHNAVRSLLHLTGVMLNDDGFLYLCKRTLVAMVQPTAMSFTETKYESYDFMKPAQ